MATDAPPVSGLEEINGTLDLATQQIRQFSRKMATDKLIMGFLSLAGLREKPLSPGQCAQGSLTIGQIGGGGKGVTDAPTHANVARAHAHPKTPGNHQERRTCGAGWGSPESSFSRACRFLVICGVITIIALKVFGVVGSENVNMPDRDAFQDIGR